MRQLPLEIKAAIIDELPYDGRYRSRDDPFCSIALVWPDVLFRIRERRFHHIDIDIRQKIRFFLTLVESAPLIARAVSSITVGEDERYAQLRDDPDSVVYGDLVGLRMLFAVLVNVSIVKVILPRRTVHIEETLQCLPLSSITDINLVFPCNSRMWTVQDALHILPLFLNMERLGFDTSALREGEEVHVNGLFRCDTLRSLSLTDHGELFHRLVDCMEFPFVLSLSLFTCELNSIILNTLDRASAHLWDTTLKELSLRDIYSGDDTEDDSVSIRLPTGLETLELELELQDTPLIDFCIRTLERHISTGSSLKTVSFWPKIGNFWPTSLDDPSVRRLDAILGSEGLGVQHLEWWIWTNDDKAEWIQRIFVCMEARFMSDEGRRKYGTTYDGPSPTRL